MARGGSQPSLVQCFRKHRWCGAGCSPPLVLCEDGVPGKDALGACSWGWAESHRCSQGVGSVGRTKDLRSALLRQRSIVGLSCWALPALLASKSAPSSTEGKQGVFPCSRGAGCSCVGAARGLRAPVAVLMGCKLVAAVLLFCLEVSRKSLCAAPRCVCVSPAVWASRNPTQKLPAEDCWGRGGRLCAVCGLCLLV